MVMEIHPSKCQVIIITNKIKHFIGTYRNHDHILEHVYCAKCLGDYRDYKQTFKSHVNAIEKKANS